MVSNKNDHSVRSTKRLFTVRYKKFRLYLDGIYLKAQLIKKKKKKAIEGIRVSVGTNNCTTIVFQMQTCTIILVIYNNN